MKRKIASIVLCVAVLSTLLYGCGGSQGGAADSGQTAAPAAEEAAEETAEPEAEAEEPAAAETEAAEPEAAEAGSGEEAAASALDKDTLVVGTNAAFPPFEYAGEDGSPDGFDIALINAIGEKLGKNIDVQDMEFDSLVSSIGGKIDMAIAGMTVTEERKNMVDFSDSYYDAVQCIVLPKDSAIASYQDLLGKKIGVQLGTTGDFAAEDIVAEDSSTTVSQYNKAVDAVNDLLNGRLDLVIIDRNPAQVFVASHPDELISLEGGQFDFETENYAIALPKGDTVLLEAVNSALAELKADGTFDALVEEYINE